MSGINSTALAQIAVGVIVERRKAKSPWLEFIWRPAAVLAGTPEAAPWTPLGEAEDTTLFYAGDAVIELYRTETANYRSNLAASAPSLWVIMRPNASRNAYKLLAVTADPAEGEALTDAGSDLVEPVPMPAAIAEAINDFIAKHHVERPFFKRRRERAALPALGCRGDEKGPKMNEHEDFVSRWSRLKHESESRRKRKTELPERAAPSGTDVTSSANEDEAAGTETRAAPIFDLASLPSIDSITARTDISLFLRSRVPAELTMAALRRAWVTDPMVRDFIGIAENQWDFTNPATIPGFGPLHETGDKLSLVAQTVPTLDSSLDEFAARLSDTDGAAEKTTSATGGSRRDKIGDTVGEKQAASAARGVDK